MDLSKSYDFFKPERLYERVHIIGCGAVGSTVAELLARFGITKMSLYDFDVVKKHNIANQMFTTKDIGRLKVEALADMLKDINPDIKDDLKVYKNGYESKRISGYVFLCVDNIDLRREIATELKSNSYVKGVFDFRMRLTDAQHFAADWADPVSVENLIKTMQFSHEEAQQATPVSACNIALSIAPTVRIICSLGVENFINFVKDGSIKTTLLFDLLNFEIISF